MPPPVLKPIPPGGYYAFSLFEYLDDEDEAATECPDARSEDEDHGEGARHTPSRATPRTDSGESPTPSEMLGFMPIDGDLPLCPVVDRCSRTVPLTSESAVTMACLHK